MRSVIAVITLVACVHAGVWALAGNKTAAPNFEGAQLNSVSYTPFNPRVRHDNSAANLRLIRADMRTLASSTRAVRTYTATNGVELVPGAAAEQGLRVTVGAWIDKPYPNDDKAKKLEDCDPSRSPANSGFAANSAELRSAIDLAKRNNNVNGIVVGNETIFAGLLHPGNCDQLVFDAQKMADRNQAALPGWVQNIPDEMKLTDQQNAELAAATTAQQLTKVREKIAVHRLTKLIQRVKKISPVPVTTGEIWSVWRDYPELVSAVDYIGVHILPYWEGVSEKAAVDAVIGAYDTLRRLYPGKRIVIAEFGWPSAGYNFKNANPGRVEQATVLRDFAARAEAYGIDYNIIEALDQPWKTDRRQRRRLLGYVRCVAASEILLDRADRRSRSLQTRRPCASAGTSFLAAHARAQRADGLAGCDAGGVRECGRRLVRHRLLFLGQTLFRTGFCLRARAWTVAADPLGRHRLCPHR